MFDKKEYNRQWKIDHPEQNREQSRRYYRNHREKELARCRKYRKDHQKQKEVEQHSRQYYLDRKEERKEHKKQYRLDNREKIREYQKQYLQTPTGKVGKQKRRRKGKFKRRGLGFIPLNEHFTGCVAHHISQNFVIYIPKEVHESLYHNIWTWKNMEQMNKLAIEFL